MSAPQDSLTAEWAVEMRLIERLQWAIPGATRRELATLLQLREEAVAHPQRNEKQQHTIGGQETPVSGSQNGSENGFPPMSFLYTHGLTGREPQEDDGQIPDWYQHEQPFRGEVHSEMGEEISPEPLMPWPNLWPFLHLLFRDDKKTTRLDMPRIIGQAIKQQPMSEIPWQRKPRWPYELILVVDFSRHLAPHFKDFKDVAQKLQRWFGRRLHLLVCLDAERQHYLYEGEQHSGFPCYRNNAQLLYIGDLGLLGREPIATARWHLLGQELRRCNVRVEAILVAHPSDWAADLKPYFHLHYWNGLRLMPAKRVTPTYSERGASSEEQAEILLAYLSWAFEINLALIRAARRKLGFYVSTESLIVQHPALMGAATTFQWRSKAVRDAYRQRFYRNGFDKGEAWGLIQHFEKCLPMELQIEQRQQLGEGFTPDQTTFIQRLVKSERAGTLSDAQRRRLLAWIERMASRAAGEMWSTQMRNLYALYWRGTEDKKQCIVPEGIDLASLPVWITGKARQRMVGLVQQRNQLVISSVDDEVKGAEVGRFQLTGQSSITLYGEYGRQKRVLDYDSEVALPEGTERITIESKTQMLTLGLMPCPPWASTIGRDRWGLFVEVEVQAVPFVMRWIPPGRYWKGSPKDEPDRWGDEDIQNQITFEQGFWLAELVCTQELWQVVMGENPSRFQGNLQRPMENVDMQDIKQFIEALNGQNEDFDFRLPSMAEWKYAFRYTRVFPNEKTSDSRHHYEKISSKVPPSFWTRWCKSLGLGIAWVDGGHFGTVPVGFRFARDPELVAR